MHAKSILFSYFKKKKTLRLIHFKERNSPTDSLFFKSTMMKLPDKSKLENCLFISKYVNNKLYSIFNSWFILSSTTHKYETSFPTKDFLKILTDTTTIYGKGAFISMVKKNGISQIKDPMINTFSL